MFAPAKRAGKAPRCLSLSYFSLEPPLKVVGHWVELRDSGDVRGCVRLALRDCVFDAGLKSFYCFAAWPGVTLMLRIMYRCKLCPAGGLYSEVLPCLNKGTRPYFLSWRQLRDNSWQKGIFSRSVRYRWSQISPALPSSDNLSVQSVGGSIITSSSSRRWQRPGELHLKMWCWFLFYRASRLEFPLIDSGAVGCYPRVLSV